MFFEVIIPFFDRLGTIDTFCDFFYYIRKLAILWTLTR